MPSSVADRPTMAHEHVFLLSKSSGYYYDTDAIREPHVSLDRAGRKDGKSAFRRQAEQKPRGRNATSHEYHPLGRNCRSVWTIPIEHGDGDHVASMPRALARRCVLAGSAYGDAVLDPFCGRGTVGRVAEQDGRRATLIDLDERSCRLAETRSAQIELLAAR